MSAPLLGAKYVAKYDQCAVQEYMMQSGTLLKAVGTAFICAVAAHTISARRNPSHAQRRKYVATCVVISLFFIALSMGCQSARLFCDVNIEKYSDASWQMKLATLSYFFAFAAPVYLCCLVDLAFFVSMRYKLKTLLGASTPRDTNAPAVSGSHDRSASQQTEGGASPTGTRRIRDSEIVTVVNRLIIYPLVFFCGWLPDSIALIIIISSGHDAIPARLVANAAAGSTGWAMALCYFVFEWRITSTKLEKRSIAGGMKNSSDLGTSSLRSSDLSAQQQQKPPQHRGVMHLGLESETSPPMESRAETMMAGHRLHDGLNDDDVDGSCHGSAEGGSEEEGDLARPRPSSFSLHIEAYAAGDRNNRY